MPGIEDLIDDIEDEDVIDEEEEEAEEMPIQDRILDALVSGIPDELLTDLASLGFDKKKLNALRNNVLEREKKKVSRTVDETYAEYRLQTAAITRDLERVSRAALYPKKGRKQNLRVATDALKARAAVLDKMVYRGQELGILPTASKNSKVQHTGAFLFASMTQEELLAKMKGLADEGKKLSDKYRAIPFAAIPDPEIFPDIMDADDIPDPISVSPKTVRRTKA